MGKVVDPLFIIVVNVISIMDNIDKDSIFRIYI